MLTTGYLIRRHEREIIRRIRDDVSLRGCVAGRAPVSESVTNTEAIG